MRELTEVNAIPKDLIDWLQEFATFLAMWAAYVVAWGLISSLESSLSLISLCCVLFSLCWRHLSEFLFGKLVHLWIGKIVFVVSASAGTHQLLLAVLAEQFVTLPALHGSEWEVQTHHALDFFNHFALQLICNHRHLDIEGRNWLWAHNLFNGLVRDQKLELLVALAIDFVTTRGYMPLPLWTTRFHSGSFI